MNRGPMLNVLADGPQEHYQLDLWFVPKTWNGKGVHGSTSAVYLQFSSQNFLVSFIPVANIVDIFTKRTFGAVLPSKSGEHVKAAVIAAFAEMGTPKVLQADNAKEFSMVLTLQTDTDIL